MEKKPSLLRTYAKYSTLSVIGIIFMSCYILADTFFIAVGIGADGLTALNLAIPVFSLMNGTGLMIGIGGATRFAILKSGGKHEKADSVFSNSIKLALLFSVVFVILGLFFSGNLSRMLGADNTVFANTKVYIKVILLFSPMFLVNNVLVFFARNNKKPNLAMIAMIAGSLSNIVLDYLFIFPLKMGMFGAVLATGIAPIVSIAVVSFMFKDKSNKLRFVKSKLKFKFVKDVTALGIYSFVVEFSFGIVMIAFNFIILSLMGNLGVAAYGVVANIAITIISVFNGLAQGAQPLVAESYGVGKIKNIKKLYKYGLITASVFSVVIYIASYFFAHPIVSVFNKDGDFNLQLLAVNGVRLYFLGFFFTGINVITAMLLSAVGRPKPSFSIVILRGFVLILPIALLFSKLFGMTGLWLAFPVTELIAAVIAAAVTASELKKLDKFSAL